MARQQSTDAISLLRSDHRNVEKLFDAFEEAKGERKAKVARQICEELIVHSTIEEELFYPALQGKIEDEELLDEAHVEHDGAKILINEILSGSPDDEFYDAKVKVLSEQIKHHVREEEKRADGLFAQAKETDVDLGQLGQRMQERKAELMGQMSEGRLPQPRTRSMRAGQLKQGERVQASS